MSRYLDPKSDLVFKKIFGNRPDLLKSFLNAVLPLSGESLIESLEYLPADNIPEIPEFKHSVVDVRCFDKQKRHFIVEMQMSWSRHFMQRLLFNAASVYVRQLKVAENYKILNKVYGLAIVSASFSGENNWFHHYRMANTRDPNKIVDDIQLILLELPQFHPKTLAEKKLTVLWMKFMTEINERTREVDPALFEVPEIKEALALTEEAAYTPAELEAYDRNWDAIRTEKTLIEDKLEEGFEKGFEKGLENGLEKGRKEREYEMARTLLSKGMDVEFVLDSTGLDSETILQIQETLQTL